MGLNESQKKERSEYLEKNLKITECSQRKPFVFISYASDNWATVFKSAVVPLQKQYGLRVYADKAFDKVNDKWIVPMLRNIRGADVVIAFVSQSYIESYACFLELLTAVNNKKQIVFVLLEEQLRLGDTTDLPNVERGVKNEILNQGANIATNTNNTSNDIMRAMKSAYTSISTLLEQDALSKYDISDAFICFLRDASVNRKSIYDLNAVKDTINSVSEKVFDPSFVEENRQQLRAEKEVSKGTESKGTESKRTESKRTEAKEMESKEMESGETEKDGSAEGRGAGTERCGAAESVGGIGKTAVPAAAAGVVLLACILLYAGGREGLGEGGNLLVWIVGCCAAVCLTVMGILTFGKRNRGKAMSISGVDSSEGNKAAQGEGDVSAEAVPVAVQSQTILRAFIRSMAVQHNGLALTVGVEPLLIGRNPRACRLVYAEGTKGVSGRHCSVAYDAAAGDFIVIDLHSTYGTFLSDGQQLKANVPYRLKPGASLYVGDKANVIRMEAEQKGS